VFIYAQSKEMEEGKWGLPADQLHQKIQTPNHEWDLAFGYRNGFTVPTSKLFQSISVPGVLLNGRIV